MARARRGSGTRGTSRPTRSLLSGGTSSVWSGLSPSCRRSEDTPIAGMSRCTGAARGRGATAGAAAVRVAPADPELAGIPGADGAAERTRRRGRGLRCVPLVGQRDDDRRRADQDEQHGRGDQPEAGDRPGLRPRCSSWDIS